MYAGEIYNHCQLSYKTIASKSVYSSRSATMPDGLVRLKNPLFLRLKSEEKEDADNEIDMLWI